MLSFLPGPGFAFHARDRDGVDRFAVTQKKNARHLSSVALRGVVDQTVLMATPPIRQSLPDPPTSRPRVNWPVVS